MKKAAAFLLAILFFMIVPISALADSGDTIVYKTRTGECYHRGSCSYLKSKIEITLQEAVDEGLRPCSRCKPPRLDEATRVATTETYKPLVPAHPSEYKKEQATEAKQTNSKTGYYLFAAAVAYIIYSKAKPKKE